MATKKATSKPRRAAKAPAKHGHGRPRKAEAESRQPLGRGLSELLRETRTVHVRGAAGEPFPPPADEEAADARPIEVALSELGHAIAAMEQLTGAECEALEAVIEPMLPRDEDPESPEPASRLTAQIARAARRVEECNAYRRARLARIDLPRG